MPLETVEEQEAEDVAGQSEEYRPFFKMLRMGVPKEAVKAKMVVKGLSPEVLDLGPDTLMSAVKIMEQQFEEAKHVIVAVPKNKTSKLRMDVIPDSLLNKGKSVWADNGSDIALPYNMLLRIEELFLRDAPVVPKPIIHKREVPVSVLEPKRVQTLGIAMKKIKINPARLTWALREMNETILTPAVVEIMLKARFWPVSDDELAALQKHSDSGRTLTDVDSLIFLIGTSVLDAMVRINALSFKFQYETSLGETVESGDCIKRCSVAVCNNSNLHKVLRAILQVTNRVNEESGKKMSGFTLASLLKLGTTKSVVDKSMSVLDFIVQCIMASNEASVLDFVNELAIVGEAKRIDLGVHLKAVREYRRGVEAVRRIKQMEGFAFQAMRQLDDLESSMQVVRDFYSNALEYFGYERHAAMTSNEFYESLWAFITMVEQAVSREKKSTEARVRKERAAAGAAKRAAKMANNPRKASIFRRPSVALFGKRKKATDDVVSFADEKPPAALTSFLRGLLRSSGDSQVSDTEGVGMSNIRQSADDNDAGIFGSVMSAPTRKTLSSMLPRIGRKIVVAGVD